MAINKGRSCTGRPFFKGVPVNNQTARMRGCRAKRNSAWVRWA